MSRKRSLEALEAFRERFVEGAARNGVDAETANRVYDKLAAFSGFGFPKSHAAAFALLAYQSAWLRRYYEVEFLCALLNAQPMGFYPPASLVRDAQRRGVTAAAGRERERVACSSRTARCASASATCGEWGGGGRGDRGRAYEDLRDLVQRAAVDRDVFQALVEAGACDCFDEPRRVLLQRPRAPPAGRGWRRAPARAAAGADGGNAGAARADGLGEDARRLPRDRASVGVHPFELLRPHCRRRPWPRSSCRTSGTAAS